MNVVMRPVKIRDRASYGRLLTACLLFVVGCVFPGDDSGKDPPPCECPNLALIVESIDWVPGVTAEKRGGSASDDQTRRGVTYEFDVVDAPKEVQRLQAALEQHGLPVDEESSVGGFRVTGRGYAVVISVLQGKLRVSVGLVDNTPDEQADEILQPFVEAIGQREARAAFVMNRTDEDIDVYQVNAREEELVRSLNEGSHEFLFFKGGGFPTGCTTGTLVARTPEGNEVARLIESLCVGELWVIEPGDSSHKLP